MLGGSIGIAILETELSQNTQIVHSRLMDFRNRLSVIGDGRQAGVNRVADPAAVLRIPQRY
jgi:hypothetical protein